MCVFIHRIIHPEINILLSFSNPHAILIYIISIFSVKHKEMLDFLSWALKFNECKWWRLVSKSKRG